VSVRKGPLFVVGVVLAAMALGGPASASLNLVDDGNFSSPVVGVGTYSLFATGATFSSWRVVGAVGNVALTSGSFAQNGFAFEADHGSQFLDLTGISDTPTGVAQAVATTVGVRYTLDFAVGNVYNPGGIFGVKSSVGLYLNGSLVLVATNARGKGMTKVAWENFSTSFTATSSATTIEFLNRDPPSDTCNLLALVSLTTRNSGTVPSTITTTIPTPRAALLPIKSLAVNWGIAAAAATLLTFPSQLFNQTLQQNYDELSLWWRRRMRFLRRRRRGAVTTEGATGHGAGTSATKTALRERRGVFVAVFLLGVLANALNDGHFGVNASSMVTLLAVALSIGIGLAVSAALGALYHVRRHGSAPRKLIAIPAGLAVAVGLVAFSRLIDFEPGYLYGLVCGVVFTRALPRDEQGQLAALGVLTTLAISAVAWVLWVPVNAAAERASPFVGIVLADDVLGALFVGGLVGSFFGMIPIKGLPGWTIKEWNAWAWVAGFAVSVLGLFQILLRPGIAGHGHRPLVASIVLFLAFGIGSFVFHEHFERKARRAHADDREGVGGPPR